MSWIPLALSRDVPVETTRAVLLEGQELVIWRGTSREVQIWEDRCPHRGMRLSFGFVREDNLNCLYHGWQYGSDARCRKIPAHPDLTVPPTIRANAFEATESGGLILANMGDPEPPPLVLAGMPVASLAIAAESESVFQLSRGTARDDMQAYEATLEGIALTIGWHRPGPGRLMIHVIARDPGTESRALIALHRLRAAAEGAAA